MRLCALLLSACTGAPTELVIATDTDLAIPAEVDTLRIEVTGAEGELQVAAARLGEGELPPPRTLVVRSESGYLGPYRVRARALLSEATVVERIADVELEADATLVLSMDLLASCVGVPCDTDETCDAGVCRPARVERTELEPFE